MTFSITLGWWLAPLVFTILCYGGALITGFRQDAPRGGDYGFGAAFSALVLFILLLLATVLSLAAWLAWALLR